MSAVSKSLILGTFAGALALAGCGGDGGGGGGMGAAATGGAAGVNPAAGVGGGDPAAGVGGGNPAAGVGGGNPAAGVGGGDPAAGSGGGNPAAGSGGTGGDGPMCDVTCDSDMDIRTGKPCENAASGVFAIKTVIDVWWQDDVTPPLVDPGRGYITVYLKGTLTDVCSDGSDGCGEMMGCGTILPPFASWANCNAYQITFPDDLWEKGPMPKFYTHGSVDKFEPGGLLDIAKATGLIGFKMAEADTAAWPTSIDNVTCPDMASGDPTSCFPDHDGDGRPGVHIVMGNIGSNYRNTGCGLTGTDPVKFQGAPLDGLFGALCDPATDNTCKRAVDLDIGLRTRLGGGGLIDTCDATGAAQGKGDSDADFLDSRVTGCKLNDGAECTIDNVKFVDSSAPMYNILDKGAAPPSNVMATPCDCPGGCLGAGCALDQTASQGSRSAVVRLGDVGQAFDCAAVRAAVDGAFPGTEF